MNCEHPTDLVVFAPPCWQRCLACGAERERPAPPIGHGEWGEWKQPHPVRDSPK